MASFLPGDSTLHGMYEGGSSSQDKSEDGARWYFARKEIEESSPSKQDGIDLKKESYLRKSYCTFLQDLGMRLKVPQVTIATAIIFCHRFFLRQSLAKNDRRTIATICMFLAGKVEETPRPLKDVILVSYEIMHKKDAAAVQKIKQKEVYEQQKELILLGERLVLATLGFDLNVHHPYKPLVEAIKKFKVAQNALAQVAWNFVNDGLRTSLCLQFKPHHIAAGAIFLAAKFLKVKLPSDGEKVWWQEFDVTPRQLEEVSNQMLELYEQNRVPPSSEVDGSIIDGSTNRMSTKVPTCSEEHIPTQNHAPAGGSCSRSATSKPGSSSRPGSEQSCKDLHNEPQRPNRSQISENGSMGSMEMKPYVNLKEDGDYKLNPYHESESPLPSQDIISKGQNSSKFWSERLDEQNQESSVRTNEAREVVDLKDKHASRGVEDKNGAVRWSPREVIKKIDKDKVKAALEKRRKSLGGVTRKTESMDEDDLIERELESGIELVAESEKNKQEVRQGWAKSSNRPEYEDLHHENDRDERRQGVIGKSNYGTDINNMEEGELSITNDPGLEYQSPKSGSRKRKAGSPSDKLFEGKQWQDSLAGSHRDKHSDYMGDGSSVGRVRHVDRDHKRHVQENHV